MNESSTHVRDSVAALKDISGAPSASDPSGDIEYIAVNPTLTHIAHAYERVRNMLDPNEEDVLRQGAIARILTRRLPEDGSHEATANALLQELIRARYIEPVPVHAAGSVAETIRRARLVLLELPDQYSDWFISMVAISVDRLFYTRHIERSAASLMYSDTWHRMAWGDVNISENERSQLLHVCCESILLNISDDDITHSYFIQEFPSMQSETFTTDDARTITTGIPTFWNDMHALLHHESRARLQRVLQPVAVPYRIIADILQQRPDAIFGEMQHLEETTRAALRSRSERIQSKMYRRAAHSILFLFVTKLSLSLALELTYELFVLRTIHWFALGLNTLFHPFLLFVASITARTPGSRNTELVVSQVHTIITGQGVLPTVPLFRQQKHGIVARSVFVLLYSAIFLTVFYGLIGTLIALQFSWVAISLFVIFLALTSFFALRIRRSISDISVIEKREGTVSTFFGFLTLPFLEFGQWLANKVSNLNIFLFTLDLFIEAPLKLTIDAAEEWIMFIRERRQEIG